MAASVRTPPSAGRSPGRLHASSAAEDTEIVRSPHAMTNRMASAFAEDARPADTTARLRATQPQLRAETPSPVAGAATFPGAHGAPPYGADIVTHLSLRSIKTSRADSSKPLDTPPAVRLRRLWQWPRLKWLLLGAILVFCLLTLTQTGPDVAARGIQHLQAVQRCEPEWPTIEPAASHLLGDPVDIPLHIRPAIAIVTMHDTRKVAMPRELSYLSGIEEGKEVDILDVVHRNRQEYADRHGYTLIDGTKHMGDARPRSWYKIKAVEAALNDYDWVFWLDADAWITNPDIKLESVLPAQGHGDFVVTEDVTGANAGAWMLKNSDWSRAFLQRWWAMESFIRPMGDTKSGDNDALKHMMATMEPSEKAARVRVPPQCAFNSYLWRPSMRQWVRLLMHGSKLRGGIWRPGHLLVHMAGWNQYKALMRLQRQFLSSSGAGMHRGLAVPLPRLSRKLALVYGDLAPALGTPMAVQRRGPQAAAQAGAEPAKRGRKVARRFLMRGAPSAGGGAGGAGGTTPPEGLEMVPTESD